MYFLVLFCPYWIRQKEVFRIMNIKFYLVNPNTYSLKDISMNVNRESDVDIKAYKKVMLHLAELYKNEEENDNIIFLVANEKITAKFNKSHIDFVDDEEKNILYKAFFIKHHNQQNG
jgi:hypothetical protein